jgi:HSP20 family protein
MEKHTMLMEYSGGNSRWPDLFRNMRYGQDDMARLLGGLRLAPQTEFPPVNVWTGTDGAVVTAEIPGISPDQLDITVHGNTVTLRGTRDPEPLADKANAIRQERAFGDFTRTVILPFRVDPDNVDARFERGIVFLELPRPAADKPRHIKVARA